MLRPCVHAQYTWSSQTSPVNDDLVSISFADTNNGWIATGDGNILHTNDSGRDWSVQKNLPDIVPSKIFFQDQNTGWLTGSAKSNLLEAYILKTIDGGENWSNISFHLSPFIINDIFFINDTMGWAVGAEFIGDTTNFILYTDNAGGEWQRQDTTNAIESILYSVHFRDTNIGHFCGKGPTFLHTGSGGRAFFGNDWWINISIPATHKDYYDQVCTGEQYGCAVGDDGKIIHTRDNWSNYTEYNTPNADTLSAISARTATTYWTVGRNGTIYALTYVTFMYNLNMMEQVTGTENDLNDVWAADANYAWSVGENGTILYYGPPQIPSVIKEQAMVSDFTINRNYPNPFNPSTTIEYYLPLKSEVTIRVYNILGEEVALLLNEAQSAGRHTAKFTGANLPSGIYLYRIQAGNRIKSGKMILSK
jgi:photosystem II stability/assembly factor-like uncharacterized protein